jgi:hypothetical protein
MSSGRSSLRNISSDKEFWLILAFNALLVYTYLIGETSASLVVLLYFVQSVFIGIQYFVRLLALAKNKSAEVDGKPRQGRYGEAIFFLLHYGFFHFVYMFFLLKMVIDLPGSVDTKMFIVFIAALLGNTVLSAISDVKQDAAEKSTPAIFFQPYLRIIPMHLLIIYGFNNSSLFEVNKALLLFIILKTGADLLMHIAVNKTYKNKRPNVTGGWI